MKLAKSTCMNDIKGQTRILNNWCFHGYLYVTISG